MTDREGIGGLNYPQDEIFSEGVELFDNPPTVKDFKSGFTQDYHPITGADSAGPYEFHIAADGKHYLILPQTRLYGVIQIEPIAPVDALADTNVGIVNLFPSSLFSHVEIEVNGIKISDATSSCYGYKSTIETILSYGKEAKLSNLQASRFYADTAGHHNDKNSNNKGWESRQKLITKSKLMDFETPIHADFFQVYKYLPNNCSIRVKLTRNTDSFSLMCKTTGKFKIKITDLILSVRKVELHPELLNTNEKLFNADQLGILPVVRTMIKTCVIPKGISAIVEPNIIQGHLPRGIIVAFVLSKSFNGSDTDNPYKFEHFGLTNISLSINGVTTPSTPYSMDFDKGLSIKAFKALSDSTGYANSNSGNGLTAYDFANGNTFIAFDLTPDQCNGWHLHEKRTGVINLHLTFKEELTEAITVIVYSSFENRLFIDKYRNIKTDYSV